MCLLCAQEKIKGGAAIKVRRPQLCWWWSKRRKTDDPYLHAPLHSANERERKRRVKSLLGSKLASARLQLQTQHKLRNSSIYLRTIISTCPAPGPILVYFRGWSTTMRFFWQKINRNLSQHIFSFLVASVSPSALCVFFRGRSWLRDWNSILCCSRACRLSVLCAITAAITPSLL